MKLHSSRSTLRLATMAVTFGLLGCGAPQPTTAPAQPDPAPAQVSTPSGAAQPDTVPQAFTSNQGVSQVQWSNNAPSPIAQPQGTQFSLPSQPPVSLSALQGQLPACIPQDQAGLYLRPLDQGAVVNAQTAISPFGGQTGCCYGTIPDLVTYGVYQHLLYYNCASVWVPYVLVANNYYPYAYEPAFQPLWSGSCLYPFFYYTNGLYYPYYFYSPSYYYGFLDWEYDWPLFRERHHDYDWDDRRRFGEHDFDEWRDRHDGNWRDRHHDEWRDRHDDEGHDPNDGGRRGRARGEGDRQRPHLGGDGPLVEQPTADAEAASSRDEARSSRPERHEDDSRNVGNLLDGTGVGSLGDQVKATVEGLLNGMGVRTPGKGHGTNAHGPARGQRRH